MPTKYSRHISTKSTPQNEPIPGSKQIKNNAGGYGYALDKWGRLDRFLILGSEGGTFYVNERKLTTDNVKSIQECLDEDHSRTIQRIVEISLEGRAPKNDPAIFALAVACSSTDDVTRAEALSALSSVCRIGTHLFQFLETIKELRGWGRGLKTAVSNWYLQKNDKNLALQVAKYRNRNSWTHKDALRLASPKAENATQQVIFRWVTTDGDFDSRSFIRKEKNKRFTYPKLNKKLLPDIIQGLELAKTKPGASGIEAAKIITKYQLPRECIPTEWFKHTAVWDAMLQHMPITAMIRNLGKMSNIGLLSVGSEATRFVNNSLADEQLLKRGRVHPLSVLIALRTYQSGRSFAASRFRSGDALTWNSVPSIVETLEEAFYKCFKFVEPTNKRWSINIDVSGSMSSPFSDNSNLSCCEAATAMALVTAHTEKDYIINGFETGLTAYPITRKTDLNAALRFTQARNFGGTDCALPMQVALKNKQQFDVFTVITDSETWAGRGQHPSQALVSYRNKMGINAKLVVIGMTSTNITIADPNDAGMLDVVGFDASVPQIIADFAK